MQQTARPRGGALLVGVLFISVGIGAIVLRQTGLDLSWPAWIIVPGIVLFLVAFAVPAPGGSGFAAAGGIVTMVGVVLAVQQATDAYATWAYAWALVAPFGVGAGLFLYGIFTGRGEIARGGLGAAVTGVVLFLVGFAFFEGVIHLNDGRFGDMTSWIVPVIIVSIGVLILVGAFLPGPWRSPHADSGGGSTGWTGTGTAPSGAGGAATAATSSSPRQVIDLPLAGATDAEVRISFGAGRLFVGPAAADKLADGTCSGGAVVSSPAPGRARLSTPSPSWNWTYVPFEWHVGLTGEVPMRLEIETGAADSELDLSLLKVTDLRIRTGAAQTKVTLPASAGTTRVEAQGGAAQVRFRVPPGVAARIRSTIALGSTDVDAMRFPRALDGRTWASPDYETATNRVEIEVSGGAGQVIVG